MMNEDDVIANAVYKELYAQLRGVHDIESLSELSGVSPNVLRQMLSQKLSRSVRKNFHRLKARVHSFEKKWEAGATFTQLAKEHDFSPIIMARLILFSRGWNKKQFNQALADPATVEDPRIRMEVIDALEEDLVFSPLEMTRAKAAGEELEAKVKAYLSQHGITATSEKENVSGGRTPDFLFDAPHKVMGVTAHWIECKASFGDEEETKRNLTRQVGPYLKLFGPGIVVYGLGMVEDPKTLEGVKVVSRKMLGV